MLGALRKFPLAIFAAAGLSLLALDLPAQEDSYAVRHGRRVFVHEANYDKSKIAPYTLENLKEDAEFVAYLRAQPLLKGILCGHGHYGVVDQFSPTAKQYMVAANFFFHGQEFTIR